MKGQVKNIFFIAAAFTQGLPVYEMMDGTIKIPLRYPDNQTKGILTCWVSWQEVSEGDKQDKDKKAMLQASFQVAKLEIDKIKMAQHKAKIKLMN